MSGAVIDMRATIGSDRSLLEADYGDPEKAETSRFDVRLLTGAQVKAGTAYPAMLITHRPTPTRACIPCHARSSRAAIRAATW